MEKLFSNKHTIFFHVDIDAFFAAVEMNDNPSLSGKPVIVGAIPGHRGVVSTCSYEARKFGVHSAMPINEAYRLCPHGIFLKPRMERYMELSDEVMRILEGFSPDITIVSIDEAFLEMTGTNRIWETPKNAAVALKEKIKSVTGLTVSVGVASNRYVAKTASDFSKPDGLTIVSEGDEEKFMASLPISKLWGAGKKTQIRFRELGIDTIPKLVAMGESLLISIFGNAGGDFLYKACRGIDPGIYSVVKNRQSISTERTFETDITDYDTLESVLGVMADELAFRMYKDNARAKTCFLKLRTDDFITTSRRLTMKNYLLSTDEILEASLSLLHQGKKGLPIRLIGLGLSNLEYGQTAQKELFEEERERKLKFERTIFKMQEKGIGKITRAKYISGTKKTKH